MLIYSIKQKRVQLLMTDIAKFNSQTYLFSLVRLKPQCKISPTVVDFCPPLMPSTSSTAMIPSFNNDRLHFTPTFVLSTGKASSQQASPSWVQTQKKRFQQCVLESIMSSQVQELKEAIPLSNYCQICQQHFKDYSLHASQKTHYLRWHNNQFNEDIQSICWLVDDYKTLSSLPVKTKSIKKGERSPPTSTKWSPKTTVANYPKRKMSLSYQQISFSQIAQRDTFNL